MKKILAGLFVLFTVIIAAHAEEELLEPDKAFAFQAEMQNGAIQAQWDVADGYYLYGSKIRFETDNPDIKLGEPQRPAGKIKDDEFFGKVEIHRGKLPVTIPIISGSGDFTLTAHSQGCADVGVCYPPHRQKVQLVASGSSSAGGKSSLESLNQELGLGQDQNEVLDPDVAFVLNTELADANTVRASLRIAPDHYLYRDKFEFSVKQGAARIGNVELPKGKTKDDEFFGRIQVYEGNVDIDIPLLRTSGDAGPIELGLVYQGCAEKTGICYPPIRKSIGFDLPSTDQVAAAESAGGGSGQVAGEDSQTFVSEQDESARVLASGETLKVIIYFFLGGLALAFTACMYPMIPILSSIIVGQGEKVTTGHAFTLSMVYVQSMAITFGVMGAVVALFAGSVNLQAYFQSPWILIPFAILFGLLALSMFGFYTIQMPAALQGKLSQVSHEQKSGTLLGVTVMGALSALIIGPCAGPVVIGALAVAAAQGDVLLGFLAMFVLGNGLGLPLLIVGTTGGKFLPKAGGWMDVVKAVAGVILLAIALVFLSRVSFIPSTAIMLAWAALFIISGIYMGALDPVGEGKQGWRKLWKGLGVVLIFYGALVMLGGMTGARNVDDPLHGSSLTTGGGVSHEQVKFKHIKTVDDLKRELASATAQGKYVMLDFYADWCTYCKEFEDYVFSHPDVQEQLKDFVLLQADVTANDEQDRALNKFTSVQAPPAILFFNPQGEELRKYRIVGAMDAETFLDRVQLVLNE